jgi:hypothetical protein
MKKQLVGFVRKKEGTLTMNIDVEAFEKAAKYSSKDGRQFVTLTANADKIAGVLGGEREVTSICQETE